MSWLVAVSFPVLLMLFTVGLQRLESLLHGDCPSATELVARLASKPVPRLDPFLLIDEPGLPTRPNPLFQPSGAANRV